MWGRTLGIGIGLALAALAWACSDDADEDATKRHAERDARAADVRISVEAGSPVEADAPRNDAADTDTDADADADAEAGAQCCPISPQPACCMEYGGSRRAGGSCGMTCDGMPPPSPLWRIAYDENGCPYWVEPARSAACCGCVAPDARD
jgi:hypothetical protein